jgi:hypothetical protein
MESVTIVAQNIPDVKQNIKDLIDLAGNLDLTIKKDTERLDSYKSQLRQLPDGKHEGHKFMASITTPTLTQIDPEKFYKLFKKGKITEKQFLSMLKVSNKAENLVSEPDFKNISVTFKGTASVSLKIT